MEWKVVAQGGSPSAASVDALTGLTGLHRDEVVLALSRGRLVAASGLSEDRAQELGDRLSRDQGIACRILPDSDERPSGPRFNVLLSGFAPGYRTRLRRKLQELTGLPPEQVVAWLSRVPFALSRNVDGETARRIRNQVTAAGGVVTVEAEKRSGPAASRPDVSAVFPCGSSPTFQGSPSPGTTPPDAPTRPAASMPLKPGEPNPDEESGDPPVIEPGNGRRLSPPPRSFSASAESDRPRRSPPPVFIIGSPPAMASALLPPRPKSVRGIEPVAPHEFLFSSPSSRLPGTPRIVGERSEECPITGPSPEVVLLHPPSGAIPAWMLLPPLIESSPDSRGGELEEGGEEPPHVIRRVLPEAIQPVQPTEDLPGPPPEPEAACPDPAEAPLLPFEEGPPPMNGIFPGPDPAPSPGRETPPRLASFNLYVCSPSTGSRDRVESALMDVLGLPRGTVTDLLERCPAWLAGFRSIEKAAEVQSLLERKGVTVASTRDLLTTPDLGRSSSAKGFHSWLTADE
jgi:hypothetical protein